MREVVYMYVVEDDKREFRKVVLRSIGDSKYEEVAWSKSPKVYTLGVDAFESEKELRKSQGWELYYTFNTRHKTDEDMFVEVMVPPSQGGWRDKKGVFWYGGTWHFDWFYKNMEDAILDIRGNFISELEHHERTKCDYIKEIDGEIDECTHKISVLDSMLEKLNYRGLEEAESDG